MTSLHIQDEERQIEPLCQHSDLELVGPDALARTGPALPTHQQQVLEAVLHIRSWLILVKVMWLK